MWWLTSATRFLSFWSAKMPTFGWLTSSQQRFTRSIAVKSGQTPSSTQISSLRSSKARNLCSSMTKIVIKLSCSVARIPVRQEELRAVYWFLSSARAEWSALFLLQTSHLSNIRYKMPFISPSSHLSQWRESFKKSATQLSSKTN
jgi:hypothetical protein